ncbi:hypothetical protein E5Q_00670 [Mixia osmundae IAM 14324]|uniref:Peptidyl-prolyl cis-trans isomerase n=1 Tax=Mixia osmundae (strain CBS 9802 / IAM 14324 / JCM 22182 / KY 12970) TaxID=764103 RepID=G7DTW3_MIXOS|nr:hypothetical protein E5Q_00670 [Mixia osmundae IAM 14324]
MADPSKEWGVYFSRTHQRPYFRSSVTNESLWEAPPQLSREQIASLPGAELLTGGKPAPKVPSSSEKISASHLLIKHRGSRRPSSWKESHVTRTTEEAYEILAGHYRELVPGSTGPSDEGASVPNPKPDRALFEQLALVHSDCSSHAQAGALGSFGRGAMQKPFEDAAFALQPGEMTSKIVSTDSGLHLIYRTA